MDLSEMRTMTRLYLDDTASDRFTDAQILLFLNAAQAECQKSIDEADEHYFSSSQPYTVVPCATSLEFELQADFKKLLLAERLFDGADPVNAEITPFLERHRRNEEVNGAAPVVYLRGTKLGVVEPSETYTLRVWYLRRIPDLSADSDVSEIPVEYHNLVCLYAARLGFLSEHREIPQSMHSEWETEMNRLASHIEARQLQAPRTVRYVEE